MNLAEREDHHRKRIGERIRTLREKYGVPSQAELARRMGAVLDAKGGGNSFKLARVISELESGKGRHRVGLAEIEAFAEAIGAQPVEFLDSLFVEGPATDEDYVEALQQRARRHVLEALSSSEMQRLVNAFAKLPPDSRRAFVAALEHLGLAFLEERMANFSVIGNRVTFPQPDALAAVSLRDALEGDLALPAEMLPAEPTPVGNAMPASDEYLEWRFGALLASAVRLGAPKATALEQLRAEHPTMPRDWIAPKEGSE